MEAAIAIASVSLIHGYVVLLVIPTIVTTATTAAMEA